MLDAIYYILLYILLLLYTKYIYIYRNRSIRYTHTHIYICNRTEIPNNLTQQFGEQWEIHTLNPGHHLKMMRRDVVEND